MTHRTKCGVDCSIFSMRSSREPLKCADTDILLASLVRLNARSRALSSTSVNDPVLETRSENSWARSGNRDARNWVRTSAESVSRFFSRNSFASSAPRFEVP